MPKMNMNRFLDDGFEEYESAGPRRNVRLSPNRKSKQAVVDAKAELVEQADGLGSFELSYNASRHERVWLLNSLGDFYENQWIDDVLRVIKGGKEATVYQCAAHPGVADGVYIAAKVYRPRQFRNLKKDHIYREGRDNLDSDGRVIKNHGLQHAMQKRTDLGLELLHTSWIEYEFKALQTLHAAGADVPAAYITANNAILMEYVGGDEVPAPTLNGIDISTREARELFQRVVHNIEIMLDHNRVHGDLSAYNILYRDGEIWLIDFPQVIDPNENRNAYMIFQRDVRRICEFFGSKGVHTDPARLARKMWTGRGLRVAPEVHPALLDEEDDTDRKYWQKIAKL